MNSHQQTIFIVDDDAAVRDSLSLLLGVLDYRVAVFADAESFLKAYKAEWRGCILLDIRMPGMDGLTLQKQLQNQGATLPVIIMTGHGDVSSAREAFRCLAVDFLEKPLDQKKLLDAISEAFDQNPRPEQASEVVTMSQQRMAQLTPRETEVMARVVAGRHNREIAAELGISPRTVEVHKARMMDKLGVGHVADLVRLQLSMDKATQ